MPILISITGPIAAGKNTTANSLVKRYVSDNRTVVVADLDDVAAMVGPPGAGGAGLWFAAHEAHGALVAQWMQSHVDAVISVGPIYDAAENAALFGRIPDGAQVLRVLNRGTSVGHLGQGRGRPAPRELRPTRVPRIRPRPLPQPHATDSL